MKAAFVFILLFCAGCASHEHRYGPVGEGAQNSGRRSAFEAYFPLDGGNLRLRSEGAVDLQPKGTKERIPALHLSVTLANTSADKSWIFDPLAQSVLYPDQGQEKAVALNAAPVEVRPGESKKVDLYFKLPPKEDGVEEFDVKWTVKTGEKETGETATFARLHERAYDAGYSPYTSFGADAYWWNDYGPRYYYRPAIRVRR